MRALALITLFLALVGVAAGSQHLTAVRGPWLLVSLPSLGTVSWRCAPTARPGVAPGLPGLALGFTARAATTHVQLSVRGRPTSRYVVQPGERPLLPFLRARIQHLRLVQRTGAGTLRAYLRVDFVPDTPTTFCYEYLPPRIRVRVEPRT
jgi:hypothetical protein